MLWILLPSLHVCEDIKKGSFHLFYSHFLQVLLFISSSLWHRPRQQPRASRRSAAASWLCTPHCAFPKRLPPVLPVSHKSARQRCRGWWSVLSPSPPRWSNWKRKVPPPLTHVQGAMSAREATGYEQLINNYCFYGPPQGPGYNLEQQEKEEEGVKWVWSLNHGWDIGIA